MTLPFEKLKNHFDAIYLLNLSSRQDKRIKMLKMLKNIGMLNCNDIYIQYATTFPYNDIIINAFNKTGKGRFTKANEFDCARNHYSIIKQSYDLQLKNILIIEDDIQFINDFELMNKFIDAIPEDYDICQFCGFSADENIKKYLCGNNSPEIFWTKHRDIGLWNAAMYALSYRGMEYYLAFMDKFFWVADGPLYKAPINDKLVNCYMSTIPIAIQADKNIIESDIRNKENDTIDYNNSNMFEFYKNNFKFFDY